MRRSHLRRPAHRTRSIRAIRIASCALALFAMVGFGSQASATICDTDPGAVDFQATVDPTIIENFLSALGEVINTPDKFDLVIPGICVDHQIKIDAGFIALITDAAPFMVSPIPGSIMVEVNLVNPPNGYAIGIDGGDYEGVNCNSICVFEIPYIGGVFNGCSIESDLVEPILSVLQVGASWDRVQLNQNADTCVTSSCEAVHPTTFTDTELVNFDVDVVGGCEVCLPEPPLPLPFDLCLDVCSGLDGLIEDLIEQPITDLVTAGFETPDGEGLLIRALSLMIRKDQGCMDIPEVIACREGMAIPAGLQQASVVPTPDVSAANGAFYLAPLAGVVFVVRRLRRTR